MAGRAWFARRFPRIVAASTSAALGLSLAGCQLFHREKAPAPPPPHQFRPSSTPRAPRSAETVRVQSVICLFDQKPWISADMAGDRDPEGVQYRIFLNAGGDRGVPRDGTIHVEMYRMGRDEKGEQTRVLVSDWHYPTSQFTRVSANLLGIGYHVQLRWAKKDVAGSEVEIVTQFEDESGNITRGATKRLRVPKYSS